MIWRQNQNLSQFQILNQNYHPNLNPIHHLFQASIKETVKVKTIKTSSKSKLLENTVQKLQTTFENM